MALLEFLFGSSKKNSTSNSTQATQNTSNTSVDGDGFLAQDSNVTVDNSQTVDYRLTDSRDLSTNLLDSSKRNSDNSSAYIDNSVTNDSRSTSTITYDLSVDAVKASLASVDKALATVGTADARRSSDAQYAIGGAYNNSLAFFNTSAAALRDAYDTNAENLAENSERVLDAVVEANRTDGQALVDTVNKFGKYAALIVGGILVVSFLRSA